MTNEEALEVLRNHQMCIRIGNGCFDRDDLFIFERDKRCLECKYCVYDSECIEAMQKAIDCLEEDMRGRTMTNRKYMESLDDREFARTLAAIAGNEGNKEEVDFWEVWLQKEKVKGEGVII